jgi:hypothetical protein
LKVPVRIGVQGPDDPVITAVKQHPLEPSAVVQPLRDHIQLLWLENFLGWLTHNDQWERLQWFLNSEFQRVADAAAAAGLTAFEAVVLILYELGTDSVLQGGAGIATTASGIIASAFSNVVRAGPAAGGPGANILDMHDYTLDGAEAGDSAEFLFDATANYLDFIDTVINLANAHFPVLGYIGIRFMPRSTALIAMQQFEANVSVEVSTAKTRLQNLFGAFWSDVQDAATRHGGIPHWGQEIPQPADYLDQRYGAGIATWRRVLGDLSADQPAVFSTPFSREKGLEPDWSGDDDAVDMFLLAFEGGDDYPVLG